MRQRLTPLGQQRRFRANHFAARCPRRSRTRVAVGSRRATGARSTTAEIARWDALAQCGRRAQPVLRKLVPAARAARCSIPTARSSCCASKPTASWSACCRSGASAATTATRCRTGATGCTPTLSRQPAGRARASRRAFWRELFAWCDRNAGARAVPASGAGARAKARSHAALRDVLAEHGRAAATVMREERAMLRSELDRRGLSRAVARRQEAQGTAPPARAASAEEGELAVERHRRRRGHRRLDRRIPRARGSGLEGRGGLGAGLRRRHRASCSARRSTARRSAAGSSGSRSGSTASRSRCSPASSARPARSRYKTAFDEALRPLLARACCCSARTSRCSSAPDIAWTDSCAAADHPMIDHFWRERRAIARHNVAIGGTARRAAVPRARRARDRLGARGIA